MTTSVTRPCFTTQHQTCKTKTTACRRPTRFFLSQTGLVVRPMVSDHITAPRHCQRAAHENCWAEKVRCSIDWQGRPIIWVDIVFLTNNSEGIVFKSDSVLAQRYQKNEVFPTTLTVSDQYRQNITVILKGLCAFSPTAIKNSAETIIPHDMTFIVCKLLLVNDQTSRAYIKVGKQ